MGIKDRIKRRLDRHGGPTGVLRAALKRGGSPRSSSREEPAQTSYEAATSSLPPEKDSEGYTAVASSDFVTEGRPSTFRVAGRNIAVYRDEGTLYAIDSACTHEDGPLGESDVVDGVITCPYHDWRFELKTGHCLSEPSRPVTTHQIKENSGFIWIGGILSEGSSDRGGEHDDGLEMR
ncbi:MAG: Rieske 2Fe-2S domain-containing protein [Myxococcota bacterium]|nr:Rieske 2Fe-2S domain-containing protein [Myxococcota bacterium]